MRKTSKLLLTALALSLLFSGNAFAAKKSKKNSKTITVGATPEPHAAILNLLVKDMKAKGFDCK